MAVCFQQFRDFTWIRLAAVCIPIIDDAGIVFPLAADVPLKHIVQVSQQDPSGNAVFGGYQAVFRHAAVFNAFHVGVHSLDSMQDMIGSDSPRYSWNRIASEAGAGWME